MEFLCNQNDTRRQIDTDYDTDNDKPEDTIAICSEEIPADPEPWDDWLLRCELQDRHRNLLHPRWISDSTNHKEPHTGPKLPGEASQVNRLGAPSNAPALQPEDTPKLPGEAATVHTVEPILENNLPPDWDLVFQQALNITQKQCQLDDINDGNVPPSL